MDSGFVSFVMVFRRIFIHYPFCILFPCISSAIKEDANRAIKLKNGSPVGGQKIVVKQAKSRSPLEQRQTKAAQG